MPEQHPEGYLAVLAHEAELDKDLTEALDTLGSVIHQACWEDHDGVLDSMAISAYADGMRLLAAHKRLVIEEEAGRRVIAHWPPEEPE